MTERKPTKKDQRRATVAAIMLWVWLPAHVFLAALWNYSLPNPWPEVRTALESALLVTSSIFAVAFGTAAAATGFLALLATAYAFGENFEDEEKPT